MTAPVPVAPQSRAELASLEEADLPEIANFIGSQSGQDKKSLESHLRWFLLENPARREQDRIGFGLRAADRLVGCILLSPQVFQYEANKILLQGSSSFYVEERHRGQGGRLFLQYCRLAKQHPLFGTSANVEAAALWKAAGGSPIPYSDGELLGVLRWPPVAEEFAHRRYSNRSLTRLAGSPASKLAALARPLSLEREASDALQPLGSADEVNALSIHKPSPKLTALRDLPYIRWRYFSGRDSTAAAFAFRSANPDREVLVTVNLRTRGYRGQIRTLNLLDIYPEVPVEDGLRIVGALIARYGKIVDAVVIRSLNPAGQKTFMEKGFQRRMFDAPLGWILDKNKLLPTADWYPVPADGDGLI
jgi:hypothetical protein